ncbi:hypothetical protein CMI47_11705 [Candidatus Pacearchaeota archaeon]|nr:hypothetical protein [Candidatus Pacearchaeota archaeon]|tara:strand:- start:523 stop:807 length:285 start_codon:yes stop_codon:yes gene_type:complete
MKFSREKLIKIIKEEHNRVQKEAENAEIDPENAAKQLDWMAKSMKKVRKAIENETELDPQMLEFIAAAAHMLDEVADALTFNELVKQHAEDGDT